MATDHARRVLAADARIKGVLEHIEVACQALNAACRDISELVGGHDHHRTLARLSDQIREVERQINLDYIREREPFKLGYSPTDEEIESKHGCALEPTS